MEMKTPFFVNLPIRYIKETPAYLDYFIEQGLAPELGIDSFSMDDVSREEHEQIAAKLRKAGLSCAVHLPFFDLHPGSMDLVILKASRKRLAQALDIAALYAPAHMIGHGSYVETSYKAFRELWRTRCIETWTELLTARPGHAPLYLENVFETAPDELTEIVAPLAHLGVGICMDIGHQHAFGGGAVRKDLQAWVEAFAPYLKHLHLHDNKGEGDSHLGMGKGDIDWELFFRCLQSEGLRPGITLEPHSPESLASSLEFMAARPEWFALS
jgi:sugar phosphate isomerase/epimerase